MTAKEYLNLPEIKNFLVFTYLGEYFIESDKGIQYISRGQLIAKLLDMGCHEETIENIFNEKCIDNKLESESKDKSDIRNEILKDADGIIEILIDYNLDEKESYINVQTIRDFSVIKMNPLSVRVYFKNMKGTTYLTIYEDNENNIYDLENLDSPHKWVNPVYKIIRILSVICNKCDNSISNCIPSSISKSLMERIDGK